MKPFIPSICVAILFTNSSCQEIIKGPEKVSWRETEEAWSGAAEVSRYTLEQGKYGEIRKGEAIFIYVREPFLKDQQVKDESGKGNYEVLKMNSRRSFLTGVYPYNTMVSVFHPLEENASDRALKLTSSIQEWCGHTFMQTNRKNGVLKTELKSYFQNEDGRIYKEEASVYLEDEIWTAIRINPTGLPTGNITMVPSSIAIRFAHRDFISEQATAGWKKSNSKTTILYTLSYQKSGRNVQIEIDRKSPYIIRSWQESYANGLLSKGKLTHQLTNFPYWNYSSNTNGIPWRDKLGLSK